MWSKKKVKKQGLKKVQGKCYFCDVSDYDCLNVHRIVPGEKGGVYDDFNTIVVCANCHNLIHSDEKKIVIDRKYRSTGPKGWVLHYWENGEEKWV
jgi:hypothetical protein